MNFLKRLFAQYYKKASIAEQFIVPPQVAIKELERRRRDPSLMRRVEDYLQNDIPDYFREKPIFYLARHIATPNFETLRFIELCKKFNMDHVIGQDSNDRFTSSNHLKRALGKMSIETSHRAQRGGGFSYLTILDFNLAQMQKFSSIRTLTGESLISFHNSLFEVTNPGEKINLADDTAWIDRNFRSNLIEHYKRQMALFIVHGVSFEFYEDDETGFVEKILQPAFEAVHKEFGVRPLICNLVPGELETEHDWEAYPRVLLSHIQNRMHGFLGKKGKIRKDLVSAPALV